MMAALRQETGGARAVSGQPVILLADNTFREDGVGPIVTLEQHDRVLLLTVEISRVIDQQSLAVCIWGSTDGIEWDGKPLLSLPRKFYCGSYDIRFDLSNRPDVKYLRAQWHVSRWARDERKPLFTFHIAMRPCQHRIALD
jgi:hypothetical protein